MSYTTILNLDVGKENPDAIEVYMELHNSHGSAPVIWNEMCKKYYGTEDHSYMFNGTLDKLWPRYKDKSIPEHERAVLMMTYDRAYIKSKNFGRAVKDIQKFLDGFKISDKWVNHWPKIIEVLKNGDDIKNFGLHCTSVSENPFYGEWDDENEDYMPDWENAFEVYEELDSI